MTSTTTAAVTAADPGRRERKKLAVRDAMADAALDLFLAQGADATTVEQISERADVAPRTFHRYFPTKLDVLFADAEEMNAAFESALAARPADEPLVIALREALTTLTGSLRSDRERELQRARVIESHDGLRAVSLRRSEAWVAAIAQASAERLGVRADDLLPRLLGGCAVAALRAARGRWLEGRSDDVTVEFLAAFDLMTCFQDAIGRSA